MYGVCDLSKELNESLGLTPKQFFESISDKELREFLDPKISKLLETIFGGQVNEVELINFANNFVDFRKKIENPSSRKRILSLLPENKRKELAWRAEISADPSNAANWNSQHLKTLREFFGIQEESVLVKDTKFLDEVVPAYGLFEHQRDVVERILPYLTQNTRRVVLHLPTGVGKTRTAMHVISHYLCNNEPSLVVWLASGKELLEQAAYEFQVAWQFLGNRPIKVSRLWGDRQSNLDELNDGFLTIGLAKAWSLLKNDSDWALRLSERTKLVVFDEAHQSIARTYRQITEELTLNPQCALIGLTATPGRTWNDIDLDGELSEFYCRNKVSLNIPSKNPIKFLIESGFLAKPTFKNLFAEPGTKISNEDLQKIADSLDLPQELIESLSMTDQYLTAVYEAVCNLLRDQHSRILVFSASVEQALLLSSMFSASGIASYSVAGISQQTQREQAIQHFQSNDPNPIVLTNFGVLTTGFDAPACSAAVIARPTKSLVLFSQMIGRVIRGPMAGGTDSCEIVTIVDRRLPGFGDVAEQFLNWEDIWG